MKDTDRASDRDRTAPSDRDLELRIIHAAADLLRGGRAGITGAAARALHDLITELARRHPQGYPMRGGVPVHPVAWPAAFTLADRAGAAPRCIAGRPETWPADLEAAAGAELDKICPSSPRIRINVHAPLGSEREPDEEYRDRLRVEREHDVARIHGRVLDIAEHVWDACAPKGGYPASTETRALAVGIITAIFEEIERKRPTAERPERQPGTVDCVTLAHGDRAATTFQIGEAVDVLTVDGWRQGHIRTIYGDGVIAVYYDPRGSTPVSPDEVGARLRHRGEYRIGDQVEVRTGGAGSRWNSVWESAVVEGDRVEVRTDGAGSRWESAVVVDGINPAAGNLLQVRFTNRGHLPVEMQRGWFVPTVVRRPT